MENNRLILSVIIPVYNVEKYLNKCLESISEQSSDQFEIIIINDGSTDQSKGICEYWETRDKRIKLVSQENKGVSAARNLGIQLASGEYIYFVDSDDWIGKGHIQNIIKHLTENNGCELLLTNYTVTQKTADRIQNKKLSSESKDIKNNDELGLLFLDHQTIGGFLFNKVFSSKIILENRLEFSKGMTIMEDLSFSLNYFSSMTSPALFIPLEGYHYAIRSESVSVNQKSKKRKSEYVYIINTLLKTLNKIPEEFQQTRKALFYFIVGESARFALYLSKTDEYYDKKYLLSIVKRQIVKYLFSSQSIEKKSKTVYYFVSAFLLNLSATPQTTYIKGDKHV